MSPAVGMRFGRYELLQKLGAGGMGVVFRARDHDLGRDVAVKFLSERYASDADGLERFAKEARAASSLNHPNIVTIHEIGHAEGGPFIVMECVSGQTVRALMSGRPLPTRRILDLAVQTADGLAQAHAAGIVHRDLKPENLMVTADGFVKILDFGLAKLRPPHRSDAAAPAEADASTQVGAPVSTRSSVGVVVGTAGYMSPEQAAGRSVDFRSDQFALGTILYEMAAGRRAFQRDTPVQTLSAVIESDPEPLATVNPSFPTQARWVVERCLAKEPDGRYASTADLARELRTVREHLSEVSSPPPRIVDSRGQERRWPWRAAAGALVVLAVLFAVPQLREGVLGPLQMLPLPAEKLVAVLPFHNAGANPDDQPLCDGLPEYIVASLGQLQRFHDTVSVVPSVEVRQSGVSTAEQARRALGATLVVTGSLQRERQRLIVTASLSDAVRGRQLRGATLGVTLGRDSPFERVVEAVVGMLDLELGPDGTAALRAGTSGVAEASTLYGQALGYKPYSQARNALQRHDQERSLERAIDLFNQALDRDRNFALAHAGLGEALWRLSRFTKNPEQVALAEEHCRRALDLDPLVWQAWVTMGIIHAGTGKAAEAVEDFQRALARDPRSSDAHRELANAYDRLGQRDRVEATYRKAIELRPDYWVNYNYFGSYLVTHGRASDAEAQYKKALALVPDNARAWSGLGAAYYAQSKYDEAVRAWRKSLALFPTPAAASNLGTRQFYQGRYAEAARDFGQALQIDDRDYRVWRNLATSYYWAPGQRDKARAAYQRAAELGEQERELDPQNPETLADLADSYAMLGEADKARSAAAGAARLGGDRMFIARMLAGVYEHLGDRTVALEWVGKALAMGLPPDEVEKAPSLAGLRADPRYQSIVESGKAAAAGRR